jgi:hypothetical protein
MNIRLPLFLLGCFNMPAASAQTTDGPAAKPHSRRLGVKGEYNVDSLRGAAEQINRQDRHDFHAGLYAQKIVFPPLGKAVSTGRFPHRVGHSSPFCLYNA